jgi:hypothetical protein
MADAKEVQQYNQAARLNDYRTNVENYFAQKEQNEVNRTLQQEQQLDTHIQNLKIRDVQLNANLKAWEKSEQGFLDQLQLNEQAQQVALMGEQKVMDERMLEAAFATDELNIRQQQQVLESKFNFEQQQNSLADAVADYDFQIAVNSLMFQETQAGLDKAEGDVNQQILTKGTDETEEKRRLSIRARDQKIDLTAEQNAIGREKAVLQREKADSLKTEKRQVDELLRTKGLKIKQLDAQIDNFTDEIAQGQSEITASSATEERTKAEILANKNIEEIRAENSKATLKDEYKFVDESLTQNQTELDNRLKAIRADAAFQSLENDIQSKISSGRARSAGRKGVSVQRAYDTITALSGLNAAKIADSLDRADNDYLLNTSRLQSERKFKLGEGTPEGEYGGIMGRQIQQFEVEKIFRDTQYDRRKAQIESDSSQERARMQLGIDRTTRAQTLTTAEKTYTQDQSADQVSQARQDAAAVRDRQSLRIADITSRETGITGAKERVDTDLTAATEFVTEKSYQTLQSLNREKSSIGLQKQMANERQRLSDAQATEQKASRKRTITTNTNRISDALGLDSNLFTLSKQQLGQQLISAAESYDTRVGQIGVKKFESDLAAYANRMIFPDIVDAEKAPYELPPIISVAPPQPVRPIRTKTGGMTPEASTTGAVLGTLGSTAMAVQAAGSAFIGPVVGVAGAAVAGIGAIGEAFDWW